jgi:hypothetical protein
MSFRTAPRVFHRHRFAPRALSNTTSVTPTNPPQGLRLQLHRVQFMADLLLESSPTLEHEVLLISRMKPSRSAFLLRVRQALLWPKQ